MLEIFGIIALTSYIGKIVREKNRKPIGYQVMAATFWIVFEILGSVTGYLLFGPGWPTYVTALSGAAIGVISSILIAKGLSIAESEDNDLLDSGMIN